MWKAAELPSLHPQHEGGAAEHTDGVIMSAVFPEFTSALSWAASDQTASGKPAVSGSAVSISEVLNMEALFSLFLLNISLLKCSQSP